MTASFSQLLIRGEHHKPLIVIYDLFTPEPVVALPCGSESINRTGTSFAANEAARLMAVVVLPTPPF